jgi:hypothetical protein
MAVEGMAGKCKQITISVTRLKAELSTLPRQVMVLNDGPPAAEDAASAHMAFLLPGNEGRVFSAGSRA